MNYINLSARIKEDGGITVNGGNRAEHKAGYQVSTHEGVEIKGMSLGHLLFIADVLELKDFGVWYDEDEGLWYMDTDSRHIATLEEATALALEHNQRAIWDWAKGEAIKMCEYIIDGRQ